MPILFSTTTAIFAQGKVPAPQKDKTLRILYTRFHVYKNPFEIRKLIYWIHIMQILQVAQECRDIYI